MKILTSLLLLIAVAGCQTAPAPDSGFNRGTNKMVENRARFPFQRVWVKPGIDRSVYDGIYIPRVNTDYLLQNTGWKAANPGNATLDEEAEKLAFYTRDAFLKAFGEWPGTTLAVRSQPTPGTVAIELAIVELVPAKAVLGAIGLVAPVAGQTAVGVGSKVVAGRPSVAIEGRVRDSVSGELLMMFADREERQVRIIDLKAVSWWGHARPIIDDWARQCAELANTPPTHQVDDRAKFTLKPW